jgi:hypothetical protein
LLELFNSEGLSLNRHIKDAVVLKKLIAFSTNVNHGLNNLFLDEQGVEAEVGELFREVVLRNGDHAKVRDFSGRGLRGET